MKNFILIEGDASFHDLSRATSFGSVLALKFSTSSDKYFFWLQDPLDEANSLVYRLNQMISKGLPNGKRKIENLYAIFQKFEQVFTEHEIMGFQQHFPDKFYLSNEEFCKFMKSTHFINAVNAVEDILNSENAVSFFAEFLLIDHVPEQRLFGVHALVHALKKKFLRQN